MTEATLCAIETVLTVVEEENANLISGDIPAATALLPRKEAALVNLARLDHVCDQPKEPDDACCSEEMTAAVKRLDAALVENKALLQQAMAAQNYIVRLLMNAAPQDTQHPHYGQTGSYAPRRRIPGRAFRNHA